MNRLLLIFLCLLFLGANLGKTVAQAARGPFLAVPIGGWEFAAARTLQKANVAFPYPQETGIYLCAGRRPLTRYEFAVAGLLAKLDSPAGADVEKKLTKTPPALNALIALVDGFQEELGKLGQDVPAACARLAAQQQTVRRAVWEGKITLAPALADNPFADVRTNQRPYEEADTLQNAGIVIGDPDRLSGGRVPMTRLQFGRSIARLMTRLTGAESLLAENAELRADLQKRLLSRPGVVDALKSLVTEFTPEMALFKQDVSAYHAYLNALPQVGSFAAQPPTDQWIYQALDTLQKAGIVMGYPDGAYSGSTRGLWPTRAKIAHALAFLLASLAPEGSPAERRHFLQEHLRQSPDALASLERLTDEFAPELKGIGQNVVMAKARLAVLRRKPFPDLALNHWAYGAVETLWQEGIMCGFPQGTFTVP